MAAVAVSASMPSEMAHALHASAKAAGRTFSAEVQLAVQAHLAGNTTKSCEQCQPAAQRDALS